METRPKDSPPSIDVLPEELANQIAAGEVVERPASVVKELVENSLDAGADKIEIAIDNGGKDSIRVIDDGCGMEREDAVRAVKRHATSKIASKEDLDSIATLGFRGEALPSIASVSKFELKTKPHDAVEGTFIDASGGSVDAVRSTGMKAGTNISVEDLFFNTPARRKFMKTTRTESRYTSKILIRMALARPDVRFVLKRDGDMKFDYPAVEDLGDRIRQVMGKDVREDLYQTFDYPDIAGVKADGYFSEPGHTQRTSKNIYTFVNGRYVEDSTVMAAIKGAYRNLLSSGRYPTVVIFLEVPYELLDVNVHPTKIEVRFNDTQPVYRAVYHAIHDGLAETPWVDEQGRQVYQLDDDAGSDGDEDDREVEELKPGVADIRARESQRASEQESPSLEERAKKGPDRPQGFDSSDLQPLQEPPETKSESGDEDAGHSYFSSLRVIGQYQKMYIICEDASGLVIIDQHAAHERIGFEKLRRIFEDDDPETQALLVPQKLELGPLQSDSLGDSLDFFERAGFEIEPFGGDTYALKSVPAVLQDADHEELIRDALDELDDTGHSDRLTEAVHSVLSRMACHSVVRGPTELNREECKSLLEQMDIIDFSANCPHGRPVYFRMGLEELEKSFDRR
jgi:DNA mismatch repair protein MutL